MGIIAFQSEFRPALLNVFGSKDYREFRATLIEMDRILVISGLEQRLISERISKLVKESEAMPSPKQLQRHYRTIRLALRYSILLGITQLSYRALALRVADSSLFQWFTHTGFVDAVRPVSKSTIERFEKMFSSEQLTELIHGLNKAVAGPIGAEKLLYREAALRFDEIFADTTCVKANIHYPVDWQLLRDATRILMQTVILIRGRGLHHRTRPPEEFIRKMNKLCIEMTHTRKKRDARKTRKMIFRRMKKLIKTVKGHALRYYVLLRDHWEEAGWSMAETQNLLDRIQGILFMLPRAIWQAHERIIGERRVASKDKLLSLYEPGTRMLVRGKSGAETEFGHGLYLAEQAEGLIVDWNFMQEQPPSDSKLVEPSLEQITEQYGTPSSYTGDRGFDAPSSRAALEECAVTNAICPRSVPALKERLHDEEFCRLQTRRGSTEARIAIFKNAYLGRPLRNKGFQNRKTRIEWCVLAHNLWKLATMAAQKRNELAAEAA